MGATSRSANGEPSASSGCGPKRRWFPTLFVNIIGPLAYFTIGRQQ